MSTMHVANTHNIQNADTNTESKHNVWKCYLFCTF